MQAPRHTRAWHSCSRAACRPTFLLRAPSGIFRPPTVQAKAGSTQEDYITVGASWVAAVASLCTFLTVTGQYTSLLNTSEEMLGRLASLERGQERLVRSQERMVNMIEEQFDQQLSVLEADVALLHADVAHTNEIAQKAFQATQDLEDRVGRVEGATSVLAELLNQGHRQGL